VISWFQSLFFKRVNFSRYGEDDMSDLDVAGFEFAGGSESDSGDSDEDEDSDEDQTQGLQTNMDLERTGGSDSDE
jgi:hypothetical protein